MIDDYDYPMSDIYSYKFYLSGSVNKFLNFCVAYLPCWFLKMAIILSHSHFLHIASVPIMVFQTFDRIIFGTLTFPGTRWYVLTARDPQRSESLRTTALEK